MEKQWQIIKPDVRLVEKISRAIKCSPVTATILVNRKITTIKKAADFFNITLNNLRPPFSIKDMDAAVNRISTAILNNDKILIFGDYDADGITATTILLEFLRYAKADVSYYIPHRTKEGYGLQINHVTDYALPNKVDLIITVDCGSSSHDAVKVAQESGVDVIITDHHNISENLPPAVAVVNPKRLDCTAGFDHLAGVGVAFYLLICLRRHLNGINFWDSRPEPNLKKLCDFVALGTIADMVPLVEENRILVKTGLDIINNSHRQGIKALKEVGGINKDSIFSNDVAFKMIPRLNAAGRIEHAKTAVELLTTDSLKTATRLARYLNDMNIKRQDTQREIFEGILLFLNNNPPMLQKRTLVLSHPDWHEGVLGIVASKIVEKFYRPVVLISTKNGMGKGSARSIPGLDIYKGFLACDNCLESFGGHSMAAGLKIRPENINLFKTSFENAVQQMTVPDNFVPTILIDCELNFDDISSELIDELELLNPFGQNNPEPIFIAKNIVVLSSAIVGKNHRRMVLTQRFCKTKKTVNAIHFNIDTSVPLVKYFDQVLFRLHWNRWNGKKNAQIVIEKA